MTVTNINKNEKMAIASKTPFLLFDFCTSENAELVLKNAKLEKEKVLFKLKNLYKDRPILFDIYTEYLSLANYEIVTMDELVRLSENQINNAIVREITKNEILDTLNIIAPASIKLIGKCLIITLSDALGGTYTRQFAEKNGKFYTKIVNFLDSSTWINNYI